MTERPILFSAPMVRAILNGMKTQTRRVVNARGLRLLDAAAQVGECHHLGACSPPLAADQSYWAQFSPYGQPGDRLWVREAWRILGDSPEDTLDMFDRADVQYRADDDQSYIDKYRPSIHMPRRFSRITLEITAVRVERLQRISEADARAEGVDALPLETRQSTPRLDYRDLWESINGPGSWDANPWVWVIEFQRAEGQR